MYKRRKSTLDPKTPKMSSVDLPEENYSPDYAYVEKPRRTSFLQRFLPVRRSTTPSIEPSKYHRGYESECQPSATRSRTVSVPVKTVVKAPKPIRPHPSQQGRSGLPILEGGALGITSDPSMAALAPVGVPSAAYLEEQARRGAYIEPLKRVPSAMEYPPALSRKASERVGRSMERQQAVSVQPSKAYTERLAEQEAKRSRSRNPKELPKKSYESLEVVPIEQPRRDESRTRDPSQPLKPALKKTSAIKQPVLKPVLKHRLTDLETKAYSEDEAGWHAKRSQSLNTKRHSRDTVFVPSKAALEDVNLKAPADGHPRSWNTRHYSQPVVRQVHEIPKAAFAQSRSSSASSPSESMTPDCTKDPSFWTQSKVRTGEAAQFDYEFTYCDPRYWDPKYKTPYVVHTQLSPFKDHPPLSWPLIDFVQRKQARRLFPLVYFDAGFDPRVDRCTVKVKRDVVMQPLSSEERRIPMTTAAEPLCDVTLVCSKLPTWPVRVWNPQGITVWDVFMAIHHNFAQPLTPQELIDIGPAYIQRCQRHFAQRCEDSPELSHVVERRGVARIDMLRGRRIFRGLEPMKGYPRCYDLQFDDGPGV